MTVIGGNGSPEVALLEPEKAGEYPVASATCAKVLLDYTPEGEYSGDQLKLLAGDVVYVLEKHPSGWWGGHKAGSNMTGWFPKTLLQPYIAQRIGEWADEEAQEPPPPSPGTAGMLLASMPTQPVAATVTTPSMRSPLCTDDRSAVASPQVARVSRKGSAGSAATTELQARSSQADKNHEVEQQALKELKLQLDAAREHSAKCTTRVEQLQDEVHRLGGAEREARALNQKLQEEIESLHTELECLKGTAKQEIDREKQSTRQLKERCDAQEAQIRVLEAALKDATQARSHSRGPMSHADVAKAGHDKPSPRLAVREATRSGPSTRDDHRHHAHTPRAEGRSTSANLPRKLFAHGNTRDEGSNVQVTMPARYIPVSAGTPSATRSASASQLPVAAPPRPTPRGGPSVSAAPGRSHTAAPQTHSARAHYASGQSISLPAHGKHASTASPRPVFRGPHQSQEPAAERRPPVRALVSEFERRSSSQTPGVPPRSADPSPSRGTTGQLTPRVQTVTARHISPQKREPAESPHSEDNSHAQLIIGMSPMQRAMPLRTTPVGLAASSPGQGPSVQDRIRQLYGGG
mmetsp:Transcript_24061/g.44181  ORF Transcript_24061/g.44181 Transcript_24061/m.44181 type:complete len:578 (-) Transcript_24061:130-1863(-)